MRGFVLNQYEPNPSHDGPILSNLNQRIKSWLKSTKTPTSKIFELAAQLAGHAEVNAVWCWGDTDLQQAVEAASSEDLKVTWSHDENDRDWLDDKQGAGNEFLRQAIEIKNIWTPYGDW